MTNDKNGNDKNLVMLIASAKSWSVRGVSHQPAFMSSRLTVIHTFYLSYLPSARRVLIDVPWSLMIGPVVAPLAHFIGMVWFQVYGGGSVLLLGMGMEFEDKIVLEGCRKGYCEYGPTTRILCWLDLLGELNSARVSSLIGNKAFYRTGDP